MIKDAYTLSAAEALSACAAGRLTSVQLVQSCLDRITETDAGIKAWAFLDPDAALAQATECDRIRKAGMPLGPLHGIPVGLKDIIDTARMPTQRGTPIFEGRQTEEVARLVEHLREAGAVIMGKTVTTELAFVHANETRNPHNPDHSPGGSSSGSAAAVAAFHVPLAIGTQTNGSVIRPASFCGTFGFKPTRGVISRNGLLQTSVSLDQVGCFGRTLADVALLTDVIGSYDHRDPVSFARPRPDMSAGAVAEAPVTPDLAWFDLPFNDRLSDDAREGFDAVLDILGPQVTRMAPADTLSNLVAVQARIHEYEIAQHQAEVFDTHWDQISDTLKPVITRARQITKTEYEDALAVKKSAEDFFADFFVEFDAIIAPSAAGEAPVFGNGTGDPIFCTLWTLAGLPCVSLPLLVGATGLPIGVQLIGSVEKDDRLLRTARWLQTTLAQAD
ncbi:Glutamyl-tRNA(Gln) amidotransferase subunit A [Sulfitobacter noctilucicola]|uniref:Asp-tRNA(Asn)/Glu-tRNA(Gln) amidotransferase A subunit family amidase n=1 Tax=Sulfitobacter noctilucicola TaxID=1342301 RepID=A0A7W6MDQ4_9RHOB|nr:amidase [Sulfitobacter noctilucicola]KIN70150.1 Glutamyl-tRNA(Gln) amidotransferase subunit A [Sulfitobacter noctilucicola]MBB4176151.1 Asp-tRNA(Asn)/Glu-tRNA(Gln) amidotransferase A subunit family amidase [Sulfitobacter noctilucicola]